MSVALVLVVVNAADVSDPATTALRAAAVDVLGPRATVRVEAEDTRTLTDAQAIALAPGADSIVELTWTEPSHATVWLHCYLTESHRWVDRTITFDPYDQPEERGRALGFAIAAMLLDSPDPRVSPPAPTPAKGPARVVNLQKPERSRASAGYAIDVTPVGSTGVDGDAGGFGASVAFRLRLLEPLSLRTSVSARFGEIRAAQATSRYGSVGFGVSYTPLRIASRWDIGARADVTFGYLDVSHLSADDDDAVGQARFLAAADALAEVAFLANETIAVIAAGGGEFAFGRTDVYTHGAQVASIPVVRIVGEIGLRVRF